MKSKINLFVIILMFMTPFLSIGQKSTQKSFTIEKGRIPSDFMQEESVLILLYDPKDTVEKNFMEKAFSGNYKGEVIYLTAKELKGEEYADTKKYRYVFSSKDGNSYSNENGNGYTSRSYSIYDRDAKKQYRKSVSIPAYAKAMIGCALNLEEVRLAALKVK